jgi:hypothetical protein
MPQSSLSGLFATPPDPKTTPDPQARLRLKPICCRRACAACSRRWDWSSAERCAWRVCGKKGGGGWTN